MPATVLIEGVLEAVAVAFTEEGEDVAACFVPDWIIGSNTLYSLSSFNSVVNMVIVIQIGLFYKVFTNKKSIVANTATKICSVIKIRALIIFPHVI